MRKLFITILLGMSSLAFSQGENDNWYFGLKTAVNFSGSTPVPLTNSNMTALEACGSVSDMNGNLLFYSDGIKVYNANHQVMPNGDNLGGHFSSEQLVILKHPKNSNQYYVFNTGTTYSTNVISYSIVDMTLQNGLGDVLPNYKNIPVVDNLGNQFHSEAITIIPGENNRFWVVIPNHQYLYSYLIDNQGIHNGNPVISNLNFPTNLSSNMRHFGVKASQRLCDKTFTNYICLSLWHENYQEAKQNKVYSFNNVTGQITNDYSLEINSIQSYSPEFNKYGSVLFLGYGLLYAVDLESSTNSNVVFSQIYDFENRPVSAMQRNKYNDIYFTRINTGYLGKILNPDLYNPANMGVDLQNIYLNSSVNNSQNAHGLPQLIETSSSAYTYYCKPENECFSDIILENPEMNTNYTYKYISIITKDKYFVDSSNGSITLKGSDYVQMLPNTEIKKGSHFIAQIENCRVKDSNKNIKGKLTNNMILNLDGFKAKEILKIKISPNPTSDVLNIKTDSKINSVSVVDMTGKKVNVKLEGTQVDVKALPAGNYLINVETKDGISTEKFIKK